MFRPYSKDEQIRGRPDKMTSDEFKFQHGKKKKNKYNAVRQTYNNYNYDSKREARHAYELDMRIKAGEVSKWERQHKISIDVMGVHIANYFIDFKVYMSDGSIEYHEVKGAVTGVFAIKWKLAKAIHPEWNFIIFK